MVLRPLGVVFDRFFTPKTPTAAFKKTQLVNFFWYFFPKRLNSTALYFGETHLTLT
ncbi:hypothetical protein HanIR_Chr02g0083241 [Helianthus annuus]|nr:hypothetical protein HanIR_Chr02g0083241 [Helianthus annuus]